MKKKSQSVLQSFEGVLLGPFDYKVRHNVQDGVIVRNKLCPTYSAGSSKVCIFRLNISKQVGKVCPISNRNVAEYYCTV